ncbi:MAG: AraC family transcriptional regulator, partial [Clostridiales bacterium]|nr:AraC family transcriptional regulator [Clostridiales bacterium]
GALAALAGINLGGEAENSYLAALAFASYYAMHMGATSAQAQALCAELNELYHDAQQKNTANQILSAAAMFLRGAFPVKAPVREKPSQYYDSIYTDREAMFLHTPYVLEERLSDAVAHGNEKLALAILHEIWSAGDKAVLAADPLRSAKNSLIGSIAFLSRSAIRAGVTADAAFALSDVLTRQIEAMPSKHQVLLAEEDILLQFIALVQRHLETQYSIPIMRALHYIDAHLDQKLRLKEVAGYAGVHPNYLSNRFNREIGQSFPKYVAMPKSQEASYFVRHTQYTMSEIAVLYGFSSQGHFISAFKSVMGITPGEYRRMNQNRMG